ncbi:MAG: DMT family transporter [Desulfobacteraceae bacterium]|nr:DMT family transporter [Desulfobacteraceae bacterium]
MRNSSSLPIKEISGYLAVFSSALCFYLSTTVIVYARKFQVEIDSSYFTLARFLLGFVIVGLVFMVKRQRPKPVSWHLLLARALFNTIAAFCFFKAVELTSLAEGNILNMTYPLFVAFFSWFLFRDQRDPIAIAIVLIAFAGVWMILIPDNHASFSTDSLWGLCSGISGAFAILYLNASRKVHDTETILFFMFGAGGLAIFCLYRQHIFLPDLKEFTFLMLCAIFSVLGQYLLTAGFRYVTALEGSIISSTRILMAALLGPVLISEPALSFTGWAGAALIFGGNVYLAFRKSGKTTDKQMAATVNLELESR